MFKVIKEFDNKYEIDINGIVRNINTKEVLKIDKNGEIHPYYNNKRHSFRLNKLVFKHFKTEIIQSFKNKGFVQLNNYFSEIKHYYFINQQGEIYSLYKNKILTPKLNNIGYYSFQLSTIKGKKDYLLHRLLGFVFIPNPFNKPTIDHLNGIRNDNRLENLRWADYKEQQTTAKKNGTLKNTKKIYDKTNNLEFESIDSCAKYYQLKPHSISDYLHNRRKTLISNVTNKSIELIFA